MKTNDQDKLDALIELLINNYYPYSKIGSGELEIKYGVHLEQIDRAMHQHIKFKPNSIGDKDWIKKTTLVWGENTGWDIKADGSIALCRVEYDIYFNFQIHYLNEHERLEYCKKHFFPD